MKKLVLWFATLLIICFWASCSKDAVKNRVTVQLDVPFEANTTHTYYLYDNVAGTTNTIKLSVENIEDNRATGLACRNTTGGSSNIYTSVYMNGQKSDTIFHMGGCTNGGEWDTINNYAPRLRFDRYSLFMLKLNPYDRAMKKVCDYSVKYVFKRN